MTRVVLLAGFIPISLAWIHVIAFEAGSLSSMESSDGSVGIDSELREGSIDWSGVDDDSLDNSTLSGSNDTDSINMYTVLSQYKSYIVGLRFSPQSSNLCYGVLVAPTLVLAANCEQTYVIAKDVPWAPAQKGARVFAKNYAKIGLRSALTGSLKDGSETIRIKKFSKYPEYDYYNSLRLTLYELAAASTQTPIKLQKGFPSLSTATAVSWTSRTDSAKLVATDVLLKTQDLCYAPDTYGYQPQCAFAWAHYTGCFIAKGSPMITTTDGVDTLIGITNDDAQCSESISPTVAYADISNVHWWISTW